MTSSRFEIREGRTGYLEAAHSDFESARRYAEQLHAEFGESFFITDLHQVVDDRVVWNAGVVSPRAKKYLAGLGRWLAAQGFNPNDWQEKR
jgi:hypothetical protein